LDALTNDFKHISALNLAMSGVEGVREFWKKLDKKQLSETSDTTSDKRAIRVKQFDAKQTQAKGLINIEKIQSAKHAVYVKSLSNISRTPSTGAAAFRCRIRNHRTGRQTGTHTYLIDDLGKLYSVSVLEKKRLFEERFKSQESISKVEKKKTQQTNKDEGTKTPEASPGILKCSVCTHTHMNEPVMLYLNAD
jgi:hypothetical protein